MATAHCSAGGEGGGALHQAGGSPSFSLMATPLPSRQCVFASPNFLYRQTLILPATTPLGAEQGGPDPILPACLSGPWCPPGAEGVGTLGISSRRLCPQGGTEQAEGGSLRWQVKGTRRPSPT